MLWSCVRSKTASEIGLWGIWVDFLCVDNAFSRGCDSRWKTRFFTYILILAYKACSNRAENSTNRKLWVFRIETVINFFSTPKKYIFFRRQKIKKIDYRNFLNEIFFKHNGGIFFKKKNIQNSKKNLKIFDRFFLDVFKKKLKMFHRFFLLELNFFSGYSFELEKA